MIKNIIFDLGGVLLDLAPERCRAKYHAIGFHQIDQLLSLAHQEGLLDLMERGLISLESYCNAIRATIQADDAQAKLPTNREIVDAFCSMADGLPAERLEAIAQLKQQGYRVSLLSNTNPVHWGYCYRYFLEAGLIPEDLFEHVWLSSDMHMAKPDPYIFLCALKESGYNPEETLFIDDNAQNCQTAESFGIHTVCPPVRSDWRESVRQKIDSLSGSK